jgi:hypothetical protein
MIYNMLITFIFVIFLLDSTLYFTRGKNVLVNAQIVQFAIVKE